MKEVFERREIRLRYGRGGLMRRGICDGPDALGDR